MIKSRVNIDQEINTDRMRQREKDRKEKKRKFEGIRKREIL
jgi:hypothetical protein